MFNLTQALAAIANKPEFSVKDRGEYIVIDYNMNSKETFVGNDDAETKILLNLRGTAFDKESGKITRLGYHKFFNYGEFPEVDKKLDFNEPHEIKQKLDGSCIFPIFIGRNNYELGTRAGVTDISVMATRWVGENEKRFGLYNDFICFCSIVDVTPIFEFCSRANRVVIDHPETFLILTGVRRISDGFYLSYRELTSISMEFGIPIVACVGETTDEAFSTMRQSVSNLVNDEGVVIQFADGHMVKIKSDDYCLKHKALDSLKFEKDVLLLALEGKIDDVLPLLDEATRMRVGVHVATFMTMFYETHRKIMRDFFEYSHIEEQKEFALAIQNSPYKSFLFSYRTGKVDMEKLLMDFCKKQCSTQEKTRQLKKFLEFTVEY